MHILALVSALNHLKLEVRFAICELLKKKQESEEIASAWSGGFQSTQYKLQIVLYPANTANISCTIISYILVYLLGMLFIIALPVQNAFLANLHNL